MNLRCPKCLGLNRDVEECFASTSLFDEDQEIEIECGHDCGRTFRVRRTVSVDYEIVPERLGETATVRGERRAGGAA